MTNPPPYHGTLRRGPTPNTVEGELIERITGWAVQLHGTLAPGGGYVLTGTLGERPGWMTVEGLDT